MRTRLVVLLALLAVSLFALVSCSVDGPPASKPEPAPLEHIAGADSTLQRFSDALVAGDDATLTGLAGEHFALVEDGRTYDLDSTLASLHESLAHGHVSRTLGKITTHLKGRVAWSRYRVTGELAGHGGSVPYGRTEAAVLVRNDDEHWHVVLLSSMPEADSH